MGHLACYRPQYFQVDILPLCSYQENPIIYSSIFPFFFSNRIYVPNTVQNLDLYGNGLPNWGTPITLWSAWDGLHQTWNFTQGMTFAKNVFLFMHSMVPFSTIKSKLPPLLYKYGRLELYTLPSLFPLLQFHFIHLYTHVETLVLPSFQIGLGTFVFLLDLHVTRSTHKYLRFYLLTN